MELRAGIRRVPVLIAVLTVSLGIAAGPADAASSTPAPRSFGVGAVGAAEPQSYPPFDDPAGDPCPFPLHGVFPVNQVVGYPYTDASGRIVAEFFTGRLTLTVTRTDTGRSRTVDLSGSGVQRIAADGSSVLYGVGPFASTQHPTDTPGPELAVLHGISALAVSAGGHKRILYSSRVENLCRELS